MGRGCYKPKAAEGKANPAGSGHPTPWMGLANNPLPARAMA